MFNTSLRQTHLSAALYLAERTYHISVRKVRKKHGNAVISILTGVGQTDAFTLAFYVIFAILLIRAITVRGNFFSLYNVGSISVHGACSDRTAISAPEKSTSAMMQHAPMNAAIAV